MANFTDVFAIGMVGWIKINIPERHIGERVNILGPNPPETKYEYFLRNHTVCFWCDTSKSKHIDHVYPHILGGLWDISNLVGACQSCNSSKRAKKPYEFYVISERYLNEDKNANTEEDFFELVTEHIQYLRTEYKKMYNISTVGL